MDRIDFCRCCCGARRSFPCYKRDGRIGRRIDHQCSKQIKKYRGDGHPSPHFRVAARESNRIARGRFIFASFGVLLLARLVSCFAKSHQNLSKMHSPSGASSFDAADFFYPKSFSRRAYRQYVQGKRCRDGENLPVKTNLVRLPCG